MIRRSASSSAAPVRAARAPAGQTISAAYAALGWVVLFFALHVYWYLGGSFASPGKIPLLPHTLMAWIFAVLEGPAWPIGAFVCLAIARGWARGPLARAAPAIVWFGCVLLLLRGGAGIIDDLARATGLLRNGLSGISTKDATGAAHLRWSIWAIEAYFLVGGVIFGVLAVRYRASQRTHDDARGVCIVGS